MSHLRHLAFAALAASACGAPALRAPDGGNGGDAPGEAETAAQRWIYVATAAGVERAKPAGGALETFGTDTETKAVYPSPDGHLVAQIVADDYAIVYEADGARTGALDVNLQVLGWKDEDTMLGIWFGPGGPGNLIEIGVTTRRYTTRSVPPQTVALGYFAVVPSPRRHWLATLTAQSQTTELVHSVVLLDFATGAFVADLGTTTATDLAWTGDERLAFSANDGSNDLLLVTPGVPAPEAISVVGVRAGCGVVGWYAPGRVIGGADGVVDSCVPVAVDVKTGATSPPTPAFSSYGARPLFQLSPDGRDVALAVGDELFVGPADGSAFRSLGHARGAIVSVGW